MRNFVFTLNGEKWFSMKAFLVMSLIVSCSRDFEEQVEIPQKNRVDKSSNEIVKINLWGNEATVLDIGDSYVFQGDVIIKKKDLFIYEQDSLSPRLSASAIRTDRKWIDNEVYYEFSNVSEAHRKIFIEAITEIQEKTYLTFHERYNEPNYIEVKYHHTDDWIANSDFIGMKGGHQEINLSTNAWTKGVIIHELGHALGLYHEQCRVDRDNYINIDTSELTDHRDIYQFETYEDLGENGMDIGDFDFNSVMLYDSYFPRRNDGVFVLVMTKKDGTPFSSQRSYLSDGDAKGLIANHPPKYFVFESYSPDPILSPNKHEKVRYLKCPENTKIKFSISKLFKINYNNYTSPKPVDLGDGLVYFPPGFDLFASYTNFSLDDYDIRATISIQKKNSVTPLYQKEIAFSHEIFSWEKEFVDIDIPKGFYTVKLTLKGSVKGTIDSQKEKNLQKVLNSPKISFGIEEVKAEGRNIFVPKDFGNPTYLRLDTFIDL